MSEKRASFFFDVSIALSSRSFRACLFTSSLSDRTLFALAMSLVDSVRFL